jgi:TolB-like protein/Flp pilus assembly protein TadD
MALNWFKNIFGNKRSVSELKIFSEGATLAVLPFKNQSHTGEPDYFSDGIAEEIINDLSAVPGLTVISRSSSKNFNKFQDLHEIAQKATLSKVIQGNIERSEDHLKLDVELIDSNEHRSIWSKNYNTEIGKTRDVLDDIIKNVLEALHVNVPEKSEVGPESRTKVDFEVYDLYLKGRYNFNQREEGLSVGKDLFNQSIKTDPTYAPAYAGLSQCYNLLGFYEKKKPVEVYPKAKEAALKALEIDSSMVEAHTSLAFEQTLYEWDWKSAEKGFLLALELNPGYATAHHWYAEFLMATGRFEEGIQQSRKAQKFDPVGLIISTLLGMAYFLSGDFDRSIAECKKTLLMAPDYLPVYIWLGLSYCKKEMYDEAINLYEKGRAISKNKNTKMTSLLAYSYAAGGKSEAAGLILKELDIMAKFGYVSALERARFAVGSGDMKTALKYLEDAFDERSTGLSWINVNPIFDNLRSQSRFGEIIQKMNFPN